MWGVMIHYHSPLSSKLISYRLWVSVQEKSVNPSKFIFRDISTCDSCITCIYVVRTAKFMKQCSNSSFVVPKFYFFSDQFRSSWSWLATQKGLCCLLFSLVSAESSCLLQIALKPYKLDIHCFHSISYICCCSVLPGPIFSFQPAYWEGRGALEWVFLIFYAGYYQC